MSVMFVRIAEIVPMKYVPVKFVTLLIVMNLTG